MAFKQFNGRRTTTGPGRMAVTDTDNTVDPTDMADIMNSTTYIFAAPYEDVGATADGISMTRGFTESGYRVDQSDGDFLTEITGASAAITATLPETGSLDTFVLAWILPSATTIVATTNERIKSLAAISSVPHRSLVVMEIDREAKLRAYYWRDVSNAAGDTAINIVPGQLHQIPLNLRAFANTSFSPNDYGFIMEQDGFGGIDNV